MAIIVGNLEAFSETGTEGIRWAFFEAGKKGYDGLHILKTGDVLKVFNDSVWDEKIWDGVVSLNSTRDVKQLSFFKAQRIDGNTVYGLPDNCDENYWLEMFFNEKPAILEI